MPFCQNKQPPDVKIRYIFSKNSVKMYRRNFSEEIIPITEAK